MEFACEVSGSSQALTLAGHCSKANNYFIYCSQTVGLRGERHKLTVCATMHNSKYDLRPYLSTDVSRYLTLLTFADIVAGRAC